MDPANVVIRPADEGDAEALTEILADGFQQDPPLQWMLPDEHDRGELSRRFFRPFVDLVLSGGRAYVTTDLSGAALWLDVDVHAEPEPEDHSLRERILDGLGAENAKRFFIIDELFSTHHPGHESHAYLPFIGVAPAFQGRGIGSALLRHQLHEFDTAGRPAYLEASSVRNVALYSRHGFAPLGDALPLPAGPSFYPMWRQPRDMNS